MKERKPLPQAAVLGVVGFGALFVLLVGYMLLIKPQKSELKSVKTEIGETRQKIAEYQAAAAASKPNATPKVKVADVYRLARAMPSQLGMPDIIIELNDVAQSSGVVLDSVTPQATTAGNGFQIVPLQVNFHGDFFAMTDFLYRLRTLVDVRHGQLEAGGRIFGIQQVTLASSEQGARDLTVQVSLQTYVYGASAAGATTPATPAPPTTTSTTTTATTSSTTTTATTPSASAEGAP